MIDTRGSLVNHRRLRAVTFAGAALALALVSAGCISTDQPSPIVIVQTPTPVATEAPATPTPEATLSASFTPWPSLAPTPTAGPTAVHTAAPTPVPSSGPTSPAAFCTGGAANWPELLKAAKTLKFAVYCASLGKGWSLTTASWAAPAGGGTFSAKYKGPSGASIEVAEGSFCLTPTVCSPAGSGTPASFGGLSGHLFNTAVLEYSIYVNPGTKTAYQILGHHMSQPTLVGIAAALKVIPKV